jgi:thiopurine S-methyltransferase
VLSLTNQNPEALTKLDSNYWNNRYLENTTGWDIGYANPVLLDYVRTHPKNSRILFPGAGSAYEVEELWKEGYSNVHALDMAPEIKSRFLARNPEFPESQYLLGNFFDVQPHFDVIIEQTFFCALDPSLRPNYVQQMHHLMNRNGKLAGLLFNFDKAEGPPFGGSKEEYMGLFKPNFEIMYMEVCENSIPPRQGNEFFFEMTAK